MQSACKELQSPNATRAASRRWQRKSGAPICRQTDVVLPICATPRAFVSQTAGQPASNNTASAGAQRRLAAFAHSARGSASAERGTKSGSFSEALASVRSGRTTSHSKWHSKLYTLPLLQGGIVYQGRAIAVPYQQNYITAGASGSSR